MKRIFYVAEPDPLVRMDLLGALRQQFPSCDVVAETTFAQVANVMSAGVFCMIVNSTLVKEDEMETLGALSDQGAKIVFVGKEIDATFEASTLEFPFTNEMILQAVTSGAADGPSIQPEAQT